MKHLGNQVLNRTSHCRVERSQLLSDLKTSNFYTGSQTVENFNNGIYLNFEHMPVNLNFVNRDALPPTLS